MFTLGEGGCVWKVGTNQRKERMSQQIEMSKRPENYALHLNCKGSLVEE